MPRVLELCLRLDGRQASRETQDLVGGEGAALLVHGTEALVLLSAVWGIWGLFV